METITKRYDLGSVTEDTACDKISARPFTRISVNAIVTDASLPVGSLSVFGSNATLDDDGQKVIACNEPVFEPPDDSWEAIPGGSTGLTADGTVGFSLSVAYRWLRAVVGMESGSASVVVELHAKAEA